MHKTFLVFSWLIVVLANLVNIGYAETIQFSHQTIDENRINIVLEWPDSIPAFTAEAEENTLLLIQSSEFEAAGGLQETFIAHENTGKGKNLILRFDAPIETPGIEQFGINIPVWIKNIKAGYDSLLIQTTQNSEFQIIKSKNRITVQIKRLPLKKKTQSVEEDLELEHLESTLLLQTNKFDAHSGITKLLQAHPDDPKFMADLAEADSRLGRWRQAIQHYGDAIRLEPDSVYLKQSHGYLRSQFGPQIRADQYYRDTSGAEVQSVSRMMVKQSFGPSYLVGVFFENRIVNDNLLRPRINGRLQVFKGTRQRWNGYVEKAHEFATTRFSIVGQETQPGVGLEHRRQLRLGELRLRGAYHEPYWGFVEGIIDEGTADRLQLRWVYEGDSPVIGKFKSKNPFSAILGISANRYGVRDDDSIAESIKVLAEVHYQLNPLLQGLSVGYQFSGEYVNLTETRIDNAGNNFNPLPLQNTQTHSWDISLINHITDHLRYDFSTGFKFDDRVSSKGPFASLELVYDSFSNLEVGVNAEFDQETIRGSNSTFTQFGAFLIWKL
jgi:tetratricopeptide (TPR) repeat protein